MIKILFMIHDLGAGGAEKVLVNLVNNMDPSKFDITVIALFGGGVNEQYLKPHIRYKTVWKKMIPANSYWMKLFTPERLHSLCVKDRYDIEVSYLEGTTQRIVAGCSDPNAKLVSWVHCEQSSRKAAASSFRSEREAERYFARYDRHVFVAETVKENFLSFFPQQAPCLVLYNTVESEKIKQLSRENAEELADDGKIRLVSVGTLKEVKGFDRLIRIVEKLVSEGYPLHLYILGQGPLKDDLTKYIAEHGLQESVTLLGYKDNPYKYVAKCDLYVCSSFREGFSTAVTESLIVGTPVVTTPVSGMKEMLGDNEFGIITEASEDSLYEAIRRLLDNPELLAHYKQQALARGDAFSTQETVEAAEKMLYEL